MDKLKPCPFCGGEPPKEKRIQTRYDRIITMSPEELADFLYDWKCSGCMKKGNSCFSQNQNIINWLMEDAPSC